MNDVWPRLVPALFALVNLFLCAHLARRLWPGDRDISALAAWLLLGGALWLLFTGPLMFDMLIVFSVLLGITGVLRAWREPGWSGWWVVGAAIGLGVLSKGPVILLHILPVALLAPWWATERRPQSWPRWYAGIGLGIVVGAAIALSWAIPAALAGGPAYSDAIFWGQTAGRMATSFAHRQPWWWYLPLLPLLLFPWLLWPPVWRALVRVRAYGRDAGVRFCLAWIVPVFIGFSLISGKQPQYLLPLFAAFALLVSHNLTHPPLPAGRWAMLPVSLSVAAVSTALLALPALMARYPKLPTWAVDISPLTGAVFMLVALALLAIPKSKDNHFRAQTLALAMAVLVVCVHIGIMPAAAPDNDLRPIGRYLRTLQDQGTPIAHLGKYHGQFQFVGRLEKPLAVIQIDGIEAWFAQHPNGKLIAYADNWQPPAQAQPEFTQAFRSSSVGVWGAAAVQVQKPKP